MAQQTTEHLQDTEKKTNVNGILDAAEAAMENNEVPLEVYNNEHVYSAELNRIFGEAWIFVGHHSEIPEAGDYVLRHIGEDPFIFVRDENDQIRVLFDSCRHRGAKLCRADKGNTSHFRCPYHGWTYRNTGELVGVPQKAKGYGDIDRSAKGLHEAPKIDSFGGLVFASLNPDAPSLEDYLGGFSWYLDLLFTLVDWEVLGEPQRWEVDVDWKTAAENTGDNYHVSVTHKSAIDANIGSTTATGTDSKLMAITKCGGHFMSMYQLQTDDDVFWGHPQEVVETFHPERVTDDQYEVAKKAGTFIGTVFPNLTFITLAGTNDPDKEPVGTLCLRQHQPKGPGEMEYIIWMLAPEGAPDEYKERAYEVAMGTFGDAGNFFADDVAVWRGIAESAGTTFADKHDATLDYSMGSDESNAPSVLSGWPGPGVVYDEGALTDANQLEFHRSWHEMMTTGSLSGEDH